MGNGASLHRYFVGADEIEIITWNSLPEEVVKVIKRHASHLEMNPAIKTLRHQGEIHGNKK